MQPQCLRGLLVRGEAWNLVYHFVTQARFSNDDIWNAQQNGIGADTPRAVPDHARNIGWEVDLGVDWKLLENMTWQTKFAYWHPGNWWAFAYPNTAYLYWLAANGTRNPTDYDNFQNATVRAGRDIDPLIALETTITLAF